MSAFVRTSESCHVADHVPDTLSVDVCHALVLPELDDEGRIGEEDIVLGDRREVHIRAGEDIRDDGAVGVSDVSTRSSIRFISLYVRVTKDE